MDTERVTELFGLSFDPVRSEKNPFVLGPEPYTPPQTLSTISPQLAWTRTDKGTGSRLDDLWHARYDPNSEATCRIAVDFVIIACNCQLRALYPEHFREPANLRTSHTRPSTPPSSAPGLLTVFPELELSTTIIDPKTRNLLRIAGRADWAYGYRSRSGADNAGSFLIAIEAKRRSALMAAEAQLLTYLAIMREERKATNKKNSVVQGFYTDGLRYVFVAIENDGSVQTSTQLSIMNLAGRRTIYNWVIKMLDTAMKSTPSATPTRAGALQDSEVENFETQVWAKAFFPGVGAPEIVVGDENMLEYDEELVLG